MIPLDISLKPGIVQNLHIGASFSPFEIETYKALFQEFSDVFAQMYEEMLHINPNIVVNEIKMYLDAKLVQQCLCLVHPKKVVVVKSEVEKILHVGFIYLIPLIDWVSNIIPVMKKNGIIHVYVDYRDVNHACPKENYLTPFIDPINDDYADSKIYSFMDVFSGYNQFNILPANQPKNAFIFP